MKRFFLVLLTGLAVICARAQTADQQYRPLGKNYVQIKNYYLTNLLQNYAPANELISNDPVLSQLAQAKIKNVSALLKANKGFGSIIATLKLSNNEIEVAANRLNALYKPGNALDVVVKKHLIPSGYYIRIDTLSAVQLLLNAWKQDAAAINNTIDVYAAGKEANYPDIDSISFNTYSKTYPKVIADGAKWIIKFYGSTRLFFLPSVNFALHTLAINNRNDAGNYEPMQFGANKAAYNRLKTINWRKYRYTLILVPGEGPAKPGIAISDGSMERCKIAVEQFKQGLAPFLMVSGGRVHPYKTRFCEAEEMKKFLMTRLGVPENAIFIEPQARHTTTNLRNCARLIFRYGMSLTKPFITSTNKIQSYYISYMERRCLADLGYVPYMLGRRLSNNEQEFVPNILSLQINPMEPLDP